MSKKKLPSLITMAKNFSKDLAKYVAAGAPNVSEKDYEDRLDACSKCVYFIEDRVRSGERPYFGGGKLRKSVFDICVISFNCEVLSVSVNPLLI